MQNYFLVQIKYHHNDYSDARIKREIIISFPNQFEGAKDDPDLLNKLSTEEESSGIFNILMKVLRNIQNNKRIYVKQKTIQERREKHELIIDPISAFLDEAIAEDSIESDYLTKDDLHAAYVKYCKLHNLPYLSKENIGKILNKPSHNLKEGRETKKGKDGKRKTFWIGVKLGVGINTDSSTRYFSFRRKLYKLKFFISFFVLHFFITLFGLVSTCIVWS